MEKNRLKKTNFRATVVSLLNNIFYKNMLLNTNLFCEEDTDSKQIKRIVFGVIENRIWLEHIISTYSKTPIKKLDKIVYISLLSGIYEIISMKGMPSYASINEYVNIVKRKLTRLAGFTNAILREVDRNVDKIKLEWKTLPNNIKYSVPDIIYDEYKKYNISVGNKELTIDDIFDRERYEYIRIDAFDEETIKDILLEFDNLGIKYKKYDGTLDFKKYRVYEVNDLSKVIKSEAFNKGLIYIEDVSSIYAIEKVYEAYIENCNNKKVKYIDVCSSPGGKVIGLAIVLEDKYGKANIEIIAADKTKEKVDKINENVSIRKKYIDAEVRDASKFFDKYKERFNIVWADVPCSGLGVINRKPDIAYNFDLSKEKDLIKIQKAIIENVKNYVAKDGIFAYSTCTILEEENERRIKDFLDKNTDFRLIYEKRFLPYDKNVKSDGFYIAIMKKSK